MKHECKITVLDSKCFPAYQEACLADPRSGPCPVIFKIERIDIPETDEEAAWLSKQNFRNTAENAYTG